MSKVKKLLIASGNPAKVARYSKFLNQYASEIIGLSEFSDIEKPTESGETAEENAQIKALHYAEKLGIVAFAEDESLFVDFLPHDRQPGVHVRRINGVDEADDDQLLKHWEKIVASVPEDERLGHWHIAYTVAWPNKKAKIIARNYPLKFYSPSSEVRIPGWPMSSLQGPVDFTRPHSEMTDKDKLFRDQKLGKSLEDVFVGLFK